MQIISSPQTVQQIGKIGEKSSGIIKNTQRIPSFTNPLKTRIPDELNFAEKIIGEVKNTPYQSLTKQLQDYYQFAKQEDLTFKLYTNPNTILSKPLQELINSGEIQHVIFGL